VFLKLFLSPLDSPLGAMLLVTDAQIGEAWSPFRTVAAGYLWRLPSR
jgi:hypothetical protein